MSKILSLIKLGGSLFSKYRVAILVISLISIMSVGAIKVVNLHNSVVATAVKSAKESLILEQSIYVEEVETQLKYVAEEDRKKLIGTILAERKKISKLEKTLLLDHDIERLLQAKPDMMIKIINNNIDDYYTRLEELTK